MRNHQESSYVPKTISGKKETELRGLIALLGRTRDRIESARIYDTILEQTRISLLPLSQHGDEYFHDQKLLFHFLVRKILDYPEIRLARERFKGDLEDFFRKKPAFKWKGLGAKELLDLAINIPLSLGDISKIVATKAGQFIITKAELASHNIAAAEHTIHDDSTVMDGHIRSASENVLLPFLEFVRRSPDYDHPVVVSLYAYLMQVLDNTCSILEHTRHHRGKNIYEKLLPLRKRLIEIIHTPRPPETLRGSMHRLFVLWIKRKKVKNA